MRREEEMRWVEYLRDFRAAHPEMSFREAKAAAEIAFKASSGSTGEERA